jgi:nucleotide-binding universal stress UspA family protein
MARFTNVLVPLDGSELAERALPALELLHRAGVERVSLVRVLDQDDDEAEVLEYLTTLAEQLRGGGLVVETAVGRGEPAETILGFAGQFQVDVLVMATHGRSGLGRMLYGSVAGSVLERTPVPVLLTRAWEPHAMAAGGGPDAAQRVLVPLDGSQRGEAVLPVVADLAASPLEAELVLLRVVEPPQQRLTGWVPGVVYSDVGSESEQAEALAYLESVGRRLADEYGLRGQGIEVDVRVGRTIDAILEAAGAHHCTLVCMVTRAQSGIGGMIVGTVTDGVLRRGSNPLLLVRPT